MKTPTDLLSDLPLVDVNLLVGFVESLLEDLDVFVVLLALHHQLLDVALLLLQDLDGLLMTTTFFIKFRLKVVHL